MAYSAMVAGNTIEAQNHLRLAQAGNRTCRQSLPAKVSFSFSMVIPLGRGRH
jgi:hypothetical protein